MELWAGIFETIPSPDGEENINFCVKVFNSSVENRVEMSARENEILLQCKGLILFAQIPGSL